MIVYTYSYGVTAANYSLYLAAYFNLLVLDSIHIYNTITYTGIDTPILHAFGLAAHETCFAT